MYVLINTQFYVHARKHFYGVVLTYTRTFEIDIIHVQYCIPHNNNNNNNLLLLL
jgi:hypothetical protein